MTETLDISQLSDTEQFEASVCRLLRIEEVWRGYGNGLEETYMIRKQGERSFREVRLGLCHVLHEFDARAAIMEKIAQACKPPALKLL